MEKIRQRRLEIRNLLEEESHTAKSLYLILSKGKIPQLVIATRECFFVLVLLLIAFSVYAFSIQKDGSRLIARAQTQDCQSLIYPCQEGLISFPDDEGKHADKQAEWWYVNFNVVNSPYSNSLAGAIALVRVNLGSGDQGYALLEITNEDSSEFFYRVVTGTIVSEIGSQSVLFTANPGSEIESVKFYQDGGDFRYKLEVDGIGIDIDIRLVSQKPPLVEGGDGYVPIFADHSSEESGYYSLTSLLVSDSRIGLPDAPRFTIGGMAWVDHQWFNIPIGYDPLALRGPHHEWFSVQLDNNVQIVAWEIFKEITPSGLKIALKNLDFIDTAGDQTHYEDFTIDPFLYWDSVDGRFARAWHLQVENEADLTIQTSIQDQYVAPYKTYEGSTNVTGTYKGTEVRGEGFAEMTLKYDLSCSPSGEICDGADNDCDFRVDEFCPPLLGDVNGDGKVDMDDVVELISEFKGSDPIADLNDDGVVNGFDFVKLISLV